MWDSELSIRLAGNLKKVCFWIMKRTAPGHHMVSQPPSSPASSASVLSLISTVKVGFPRTSSSSKGEATTRAQVPPARSLGHLHRAVSIWGRGAGQGCASGAVVSPGVFGPCAAGSPGERLDVTGPCLGDGVGTQDCSHLHSQLSPGRQLPGPTPGSHSPGGRPILPLTASWWASLSLSFPHCDRGRMMPPAP